MNQTEVREILETHGGILDGHFKLSSGKHSELFVQTSLVLCHPAVAERLGHELGRRFAQDGATVVLGPAMGGVIIGHEIARYLDIPMIYAEREQGSLTLRRSFSLSGEDRVLVAENTVTTGGSQQEAIDLARLHDAHVVGVAAIVDRSPGVSFGVRFEALLELEATAWDERDCPLCRAGVPVVAPGSRHLR